MPDTPGSPRGVIAGIVQKFLSGQLSIILIISALCLGVAAIVATPKEEEPQIVVPMADIYVQAPGAAPEEVEHLVATPLERLLWQVDGVEYVYSISRQDMAIVTVRFFVGEDRENSLIKLHNRIMMHRDIVPPIVTGWVVKPVEIDDVPIVNLTLYSDRHDDHQLHRIGEEVLAQLAKLENISCTRVCSGRQREVRVELLPEKMAGFGVSMVEVSRALQGADSSVTAGSLTKFNREYTVSSNAFLSSAQDVARLVVGVQHQRPVYLQDIAEIIDGPEEIENHSRIGFSHHYRKTHGLEDTPPRYPAVTLGISKKKGTNAVRVADEVLTEIARLQEEIIPGGVRVEVTRNFGETARQKVNELLSSLGFAIAAVVVLLTITMGWREALVVAMAVPISFCLALFVNFLFGYTINRVTLFALILSLGLVVDDPITNVDNIQRHILMGLRKPVDATLYAVSEVLPPVIMSTLAIIVSFTPLFFITGMMGPYMAPMASNVPLTVTFSTFCALTIVPWLSHLLLRKLKPTGTTSAVEQAEKMKASALHRTYRRFLNPFLASRKKRYLLLATVLGLLLFSMSLGLFRLVPLKLLPFDNKNEFQIVLDLPEGTPLEATDAVVRRFEAYLETVPEITNFVSYTGTASPMDFNGMVRHYFLRQAGNLADIRVNLADKDHRAQQSHALVLRLRKDLEQIAAANGVAMKIVETPPGPPVLSTLVAEIYGDIDRSYSELTAGAAHVKKIMHAEPFVVDIDDSVETARSRINFVLDKEKAALHGISTQTVNQTLRMSVSGDTAATVHLPGERQPLLVRAVLPLEKRSGTSFLGQIPVKTATGAMIPLAELVMPEIIPAEQTIYHKNMKRVVLVTAEMAGRAPAEAILDMQDRLKKDPVPEGLKVQWAGEGEWKITIRVFRDMGLAFAAAMLGIYILLIINTGSFFMPLLIMMAIPLTLLGIMPGFWLLNLFTAESVGGFANPVFFTATSMIGMIALGGIVIRNSLVLIEFIQDAVSQGLDFREAILESGAIRMRPILLTAATTAIGAFPITLDPVFSGLAWALIFGLLASTVFTLLVVPVTYFALYRRQFEEVASVSSPTGEEDLA